MSAEMLVGADVRSQRSAIERQGSQAPRLREIERASDRGGKLVARVLAFARQGQGERREQRERRGLADVDARGQAGLGDGAYQRPGMDATSPEMARTALERAAASFLRRDLAL